MVKIVGHHLRSVSKNNSLNHMQVSHSDNILYE